MRKIRLFSIAALALALAACSNDDNMLETQSPAANGKLRFTATIATPGTGATTRTEYTEITSGDDAGTINVKWKVGDKIALVHNGVVDEAEVKTVDDVTGKATIEADITGSPTDNDDVYLAYPADAVGSATPSSSLPFTPNTTTFDKVKSQDGTLEFIQNNLDLRVGSGKLAVSGDKATLKGSVSIPSLICIWKLTLQDDAATPNALNATKLTFKNNTDTQAEATSTGKSEYYLCVVPSFIPAPSGTFSFEATVGSDTYTFSKTGLSLTAGNYYQSTLKMAKASVPVTAITLNKTETLLGVGNTETLSVSSVTPDNATDQSVTWSSDNTSVATVDASTGVVTGVAKGTANITATANDGSGVSATCAVKVSTLAAAFVDGAVIKVSFKWRGGNAGDYVQGTYSASSGTFTVSKGGSKWGTDSRAVYKVEKSGNNITIGAGIRYYEMEGMQWTFNATSDTYTYTPGDIVKDMPTEFGLISVTLNGTDITSQLTKQ